MLELNNTTKAKINFKKLAALTERFLRAYKKNNYSVSLAIIGTAKMRRLNSDYRGIDKTTDVLSFPGKDSSGRIGNKFPAGKYLGEVLINIEETKKTSKYSDIFEKAPKPEYLFYFIFIHGLLHLAGYDDKTERGRLEMVRRGKDFLQKNGII